MAVNTWDGASDTNWNDAANWNTTGVTDRVPTSADDVVIANVSNDPVIPDSLNPEIKSLLIESGGHLTCGANTITINGIASSWSVDVVSGGELVNSDCTFLFNSAADQKVRLLGTGNFHNVTVSKSDNDMVQGSNLTIEGDLSLTFATAHTWRPNSASHTLTVTGDVTIVEGKLGDVTNYTGAISFGSLTIESGGTYIATSNTTTLTDNFLNNGTFTHNDGTLDMTGANKTLNKVDSSAATTLYNLTCTNNTELGDKSNTFTVERTLTIASGKVLYIRSYPSGGNAVVLALGKSTASTVAEGGSITGAGLIYFNNTTAASTVKGLSTIYPCVVNSADWDWDGMTGAGNVRIANLDYDPDVTTGGNGTTITLEGDCEFDAVTVTAGDTLDINDQRMECSGAFLSNGTFNMGASAGSMLIASQFTINGAIGEEEGANFIATGGSAGTAQEFTDGSFVGDATSNIFINNGTTSNNWNGAGSWAGNMIVASPFVSVHATENQCNNLTIPTGGTLNADNDTITVAGDFTTSGGLLGASCYNCDSSSDYFANTGSIDFRSGSARDYSVEFWMKPDGVSGTQRLIHSDQKFVIYQSDDDIIFAPNYDVNFTASTVLTTGKWTHVACTWDTSGNALQIFIDGKLVLSGTDTTADKTGAAAIYLGRKHDASQEYNGYLDEVRLWTDIRTQAEIRADMFQGGTLANSGNLFARWSLNEGTGTSSDNAEGTSGNDLTVVAGGWAGAGTFTYGTSTLVFNGTSSKFYHRNDEEFYKLTVNSGKTLTLHGVHASGTALLPKHNLTINGTLASNGSERLNLESSFAGVLDFTGGTLTGLNKLQMTNTSGTINLPACTTARLDIDGNGGTTKLTGAVTITDALTTDYGTLDVDSQTLTLGASSADMSMTVANNATVNIDGGTIKMGTSGTGSGINFNTNMTLSATNGATIEGYSSSNRAKCKFRVENDLEIVGTAKHLEIVSDSDTHQLTVIGHVINCTTNDTDDKFIQWHHTLDTQQLLDADSAGDDDLRLTRPALDNAHELMTG